MNAERQRIYRRVAGVLLRLVPIRPGLSYDPKELSRTSRSPTQDDYAKLKHSKRYLNGTENYRMPIRPNMTSNCEGVFGVTTFVDSGLAGCTTTRESTTGCTTTVRGVPTHHSSRTSSTVAISSGEAALHALSPGTTQTMGVLRVVRGCNIKTKGYVTLCMGSTAGSQW